MWRKNLNDRKMSKGKKTDNENKTKWKSRDILATGRQLLQNNGTK